MVWLIFLINMTVGGITPPFGLILFTLKGAAPSSVSLLDVYKSSFPFIFLILLGSALIYIFPGIATWLPNMINQ